MGLPAYQEELALEEELPFQRLALLLALNQEKPAQERGELPLDQLHQEKVLLDQEEANQALEHQGVVLAPYLASVASSAAAPVASASRLPATDPYRTGLDQVVHDLL